MVFMTLPIRVLERLHVCTVLKHSASVSWKSAVQCINGDAAQDIVFMSNNLSKILFKCLVLRLKLNFFIWGDKTSFDTYILT